MEWRISDLTHFIKFIVVWDSKTYALIPRTYVNTPLNNDANEFIKSLLIFVFIVKCLNRSLTIVLLVRFLYSDSSCSVCDERLALNTTTQS